MNKVQLSLTNEEAAILMGYGSQFGYSLPKTIRYVISKAAEAFMRESKYQVFEMSKKREEAGLKAIQEKKEGKAIRVDNVNEYFDNL